MQQIKLAAQNEKWTTHRKVVRAFQHRAPQRPSHRQSLHAEHLAMHKAAQQRFPLLFAVALTALALSDG